MFCEREREEVERALTKEGRKEGIKGFEFLGFFLVEKKELHVTHHYMLKGWLNKSQAHKMRYSNFQHMFNKRT